MLRFFGLPEAAPFLGTISKPETDPFLEPSRGHSISWVYQRPLCFLGLEAAPFLGSTRGCSVSWAYQRSLRFWANQKMFRCLGISEAFLLMGLSEASLFLGPIGGYSYSWFHQGYLLTLGLRRAYSLYWANRKPRRFSGLLEASLGLHESLPFLRPTRRPLCLLGLLKAYPFHRPTESLSVS
jgi:hypothetical protein